METNFPASLARRDAERIRGYQELLDFYHGKQWPGRPKAGERRLTFNYARTMVDKVSSYLMSGLSFAVDALEGGDERRARQAEEVLFKTYEENGLEELDLDTEIDCAILGDACFKVTWDNEEERVRVTSPDIQGIYAWWVGDDVGHIYKVASRYRLGADEIELLYGARPKKREAWVSEVWTDNTFELFIDNELGQSEANPYGFIPFVIYPNLREPKCFWGVSDLPQIMESQRELNRALSQLSRILELSGNPIAVLENIESSEDITVRPGAVWNIPEDAKAYLLDLLQGGGARLHLDYIDLLYRTIHDLGESPRAAFGGTERDLSGVALEIELHPLLQKVKRKRTIRTRAFKKRNEMALRLYRQFTGEDFGRISQRVVWGPVLPQDSSRQVSAEKTLVEAGIHSRRRAMDEMGIKDPEKEFGRWLQEEETILRMEKERLSQPLTEAPQ